MGDELLKILQTVMHLSVIAHDTLIGEPDRKTLMLNIVSLAGSNKLPFVTTLANFNLAYVSRGTKADPMRWFVGKMYRKLVDDGVGIVWHQFLFVSGTRLLGHGWKVNLVYVEFLIRSQITQHF